MNNKEEITKKLLIKYEFINKELILDCINKVNINDINYEDQINKEIINVIKKEYEINEFDLLKNYINKKFNNLYQTNIIKFLNLLETLNININPDNALELLNNKIFYITIKNLYSHNININNNNYKVIINSYLMINNIDLEDNNINKDDTITEDSYKQYLKEIRKYPILTKEEEIELARKSQKGDESARKRLIECNLRLTLSTAHKYYNSSLDILDLIQEGNMGLMEAVKRFNPELGYRFSTYAYNWINMYISKYVYHKNRIIKLPNNLIVLNNRINSEIIKLTNELGREPSRKEISEKINIEEKELAFIQNVTNNCTSLNIFINNDNEDDTQLGDLIADPKCKDEEIINEIKLEDIEYLFEIAKLNEKEIEAIKMRYGFYNNKLYKLEEIGNKFSVSKERARVIIETALIKIRKCQAIINYSNYADNPQKALNYINLYNSESKEQIKSLIELKRYYSFEDIINANKIYDLFYYYNYDDIDKAINNLDEKDKLLINRIWNNNKNNFNDIERKNRIYFYKKVIPIIHNYLIFNAIKSSQRRKKKYN